MTAQPNGCSRPPPGLSGRRSLRSLACVEFDRILTRKRAAQAVVHPLNFVCIPIVRTPRSGVCGHVWSKERVTPTIHAHSWHLYSEVVLGAIANEVFHVGEQPGGDFRVVQVRSTGLTDRITPTRSTVRVGRTEVQICRVGGTYALSANTFHRSTPVTAGLTLTLVRATMLAGHTDRILVRPPGVVDTEHRSLLPENLAFSLVDTFRRAVEVDELSQAPS